MVATADIEKGETLFDVPRNLLLTQENSGIGELLKQGWHYS